MTTRKLAAIAGLASAVTLMAGCAAVLPNTGTQEASPRLTMADWCASPGWTAQQNAVADVAAIQADVTRYHSMDAVTNDGNDLSVNAGNAIASPPPITGQPKLTWTLAMGWLQDAGTQAGAGNTSVALSDIQLYTNAAPVLPAC